MKKTLLSTALLAILCTSAQAENSPPIAAVNKPISPATSSSAETPNQPIEINCKYHIPTNTTTIEQSLISTWASKAAVQSFEFNPTSIDAELTELKSCYTDQGWQGFNDALQKSGNIESFKKQGLTVSSLVDGELKVNPVKDNQWKVSIPLQVVYQNDKEKLTQKLNVDLLIGRKMSGDLGIMQMIAIPIETANLKQPVVAAPVSKENTATNENPADLTTNTAKP